MEIHWEIQEKGRLRKFLTKGCFASQYYFLLEAQVTLRHSGQGCDFHGSLSWAQAEPRAEPGLLERTWGTVQSPTTWAVDTSLTLCQRTEVLGERLSCINHTTVECEERISLMASMNR